MKHEPRSLALLRKANPVSVDPAVLLAPQASATFEQIVGERRVSKRRRWGRLSAPGLRARVAVGGAGISAVAAAIIVVVLSGSAAAPAFAGWTARPTVALKQQIIAATRRCGLTDPTLVEVRGPYTAAVFASKAGGSACVLGPSMWDVSSVGGVQAPDNRFKPDQIGLAGGTGTDGEGHAYTLLTGRVGSAVRSVVIHRSNHSDVIASVRDGWYLAWWPARTRAVSATVTTTHGSQDVALPAGAQTTPSCSRPIHTGIPHVVCGSTYASSNGPGSAGVPGPPLIGQVFGKPFDRALLINIEDASRVLTCFKPPSNQSAALQPNGPTGPCTHATLVTRLPPRYPIQKNLLELLPKSVWKITLPAGWHRTSPLVVLLVASGTSRYGLMGKARYGQERTEITVNP